MDSVKRRILDNRIRLKTLAATDVRNFRLVIIARLALRADFRHNSRCADTWKPFMPAFAAVQLLNLDSCNMTPDVGNTHNRSLPQFYAIGAT